MLVATRHLVAFRCRFVRFWDCFFRGFPISRRQKRKRILLQSSRARGPNTFFCHKELEGWNSWQELKGAYDRHNRGHCKSLSVVETFGHPRNDLRLLLCDVRLRREPTSG